MMEPAGTPTGGSGMTAPRRCSAPAIAEMALRLVSRPMRCPASSTTGSPSREVARSGSTLFSVRAEATGVSTRCIIEETASPGFERVRVSRSTVPTRRPASSVTNQPPIVQPTVATLASEAVMPVRSEIAAGSASRPAVRTEATSICSTKRRT